MQQYHDNFKLGPIPRVAFMMWKDGSVHGTVHPDQYCQLAAELRALADKFDNAHLTHLESIKNAEHAAMTTVPPSRLEVLERQIAEERARIAAIPKPLGGAVPVPNPPPAPRVMANQILFPTAAAMAEPLSGTVTKVGIVSEGREPDDGFLGPPPADL